MPSLKTRVVRSLSSFLVPHTPSTTVNIISIFPSKIFFSRQTSRVSETRSNPYFVVLLSSEPDFTNYTSFTLKIIAGSLASNSVFALFPIMVISRTVICPINIFRFDFVGFRSILWFGRWFIYRLNHMLYQRQTSRKISL